MQKLYRNPYIQFAFVFLVKLVMVFYFAYLESGSWETLKLYFAGGDALSYYGPIESYIEYGVYSYSKALTPYAGRMPYYGSVYFILRLMFEQNIAFNGLVVLQLMVESLAILYLCRIVKEFVPKFKDAAYWCVFVFSILNGATTIWSRYILTESFSISCFVFYAYFLQKYLKSRTVKDLIRTGIFLGLMITLRPYLILLFLPIGLTFCYQCWRKKEYWQLLVKNVLIVSLPMILLLSPWVIRNAVVFNRFIPLQDDMQAGYKYSESYYAMWDFIAAWGGSIQSWDKRAAGCIFEPRFNQDCTFEYPDYVFTSKYNFEDLEQLRQEYIEVCLSFNADEDRAVASKFGQYKDAFIKEHPLRYYLLAPLQLSFEMIFHSGSYNIATIGSGWLKWPSLLFKIMQSILYYLMLLLGVFGLLRFLQSPFILNLIFTPCIILVLFGMILKAPEFRFFIHAYPVLVISAIIFALSFGEKLPINRFKLLGKIS